MVSHGELTCRVDPQVGPTSPSSYEPVDLIASSHQLNLSDHIAITHTHIYNNGWRTTISFPKVSHHIFKLRVELLIRQKKD